MNNSIKNGLQFASINFGFIFGTLHLELNINHRESWYAQINNTNEMR